MSFDVSSIVMEEKMFITLLLQRNKTAQLS